MKSRSDQEKLAAWLRERELDRSLAEAYPDGPETERGRPPGTALSIGPAGEELDEGAIVLLPPCGPFTGGRPVYVALVRALEGDRWEAVPFSPYSVPATEGEWSTGRDAEPLKVLCPWNRGELPAALLRAGWRTGRLTDEERGWLREGRAPRERLGPPLVHPLDPRRDYLEEERALWFDGEGLRYQAADCVEESVPKAADKKSKGYE